MSDDIKIKVLKSLQLQYIVKEADFFKKVHDLEVEFEKQNDDLYDKRQKLITGGNLTVCDVGVVSEDGDNTTKVSEVSEPSGIPNFWLTAFENSSVVGKTIEPCDRDILAYLYDVQVKSRSEPMGFDLEFLFQPNRHFENSVLTKSYEMRCGPDPCDPFDYDGPEIVSCKGCNIAWKKGINITQDKTKTIYEEKGGVVTKFHTFFNFFTPPSTEKLSDEMDDDMYDALEEDFEIGRVMRDCIIPSAVLYYLDEASGESSDDDNDEASDESSDDDNDEASDESSDDDNDEADENDECETSIIEIEPTAGNGGVKC